jgi:hypothetical protein
MSTPIAPRRRRAAPRLHAQIFGVRLTCMFAKAAAKFVLENQHKRRLDERYLATQVADAVDRT